MRNIGCRCIRLYFANVFSLGNLAIGILALLVTYESLALLWDAVRSAKTLKQPAIHIGIATMLVLFFIGAIWNYHVSFAYWLPASYPSAVRDQLRMVARLVYAEKKTTDTVTGALSGIHLLHRGTDLIPDSVRAAGLYQDYVYTLLADNREPGRFSIEATPREYRTGSLSFHGFGYFNSDYEKSFYECITIVDNGGHPATDSDRHFHSRDLFSLWFLAR